MQILYDNRENIDLCEIKKALDIDPRLELPSTTGMNGTPDHSNLMAMGANFYSHPNIYTPPGGIYGSGQLKYQSPSAAAALFGPSMMSPSVPLQCQLATGSGPLFPSGGAGSGPFDLLASPTTMMGGGVNGRRYKPNVNYLFPKPGFGNGNYACPPASVQGSYYYNGATNYPWNGQGGGGGLGGGVGNPMSLNQRLMAGLDCSYPSAAAMRNYHYGSHPTISKYGNTPRNAFLSSYNYFPNHNINNNNLTSSATNSCYPPSFLHDGPAAATCSYNNPFSMSASPGYGNYSQPTSFLQQQHQGYRHGPYGGGGSGGFQHPPRSLPLSYYPAYKVSAGGGGFYNATRHGGGGAFNANSLSRVGNLVGGGGSGTSAGDMKRQVSFKFDVDQLSIGS